MQTRMFERCHEFYVHARPKLIQRDVFEIANATDKSVSFDINTSTTISRRLSALPKITLPHFSGIIKNGDFFTTYFHRLSGISEINGC